MSDLYAVTVAYQGERFYYRPFAGAPLQTAAFSTPFGPVLAEAYFAAKENPDLEDVQIVRMK